MDLGTWEALIWIGTLAFTVALIPQVARTLRRGRADDVSAAFIVLIIFASACTLAYWLLKEEWVAASGFVANIVAWSIVLFYRLRPRASPRETA